MKSEGFVVESREALTLYSVPAQSGLSEVWSHPPGLNRRPADYESIMCGFEVFVQIAIYLYFQ
jgi:hypothetical protein